MLFLNINKIKQHDQKYHNLIQLLKSNSKEVFNSVKQFIILNSLVDIELLLNKILKNNYILCNEILTEKDLSEEKKELSLNIYLSKTTSFEENIFVETFSNYINSSKNYSNILKGITSDKLNNLLYLFRIKIKTLSGNPEEIINKSIIENNCYEINIDNLNLITNNNNNKDFYNKNYEFISKNEGVRKYINENINDYILNVFNNENIENKNEDSNNIDLFLKNEELSFINKKNIIEKYSFKVNKINEYDKELHSSLISTNNFLPTWDNIFNALQSSEKIIETIVNYLLKNENSIDGDSLNPDFKNTYEELLIYIVNHKNDLYTTSEFERFAKKSPFKVNLNSEYRNDDVLSVFIENNMFEFDESDFKILIDKQKSLLSYLKLYGNNVNDVFLTFFNSNIDSEILTTLLLHRDTSKSIKQKLINSFSRILIIDGFEEQLFALITKNNFTIPIDFLYKFTNSSLSNFNKCVLATHITPIETSDLGKFNTYVREAIPALKALDSNQKVRIELKDESKSKTLYNFAELNSLKTYKRNNRLTISKSS